MLKEYQDQDGYDLGIGCDLRRAHLQHQEAEGEGLGQAAGGEVRAGAALQHLSHEVPGVRAAAAIQVPPQRLPHTKAVLGRLQRTTRQRCHPPTVLPMA